MDYHDKNIEHNDSKRRIGAQIDELIKIGNNVIRMGDSISVDVQLRALENSKKENEINNMQKQIHYLTTEFEKLKKQLNKDATQ